MRTRTLAAVALLSLASSLTSRANVGELVKQLSEKRTLSVLAIGNSFTLSLNQYLPGLAAATTNCDLNIAIMYIGGCSLRRHADNIRTASTNETFAPYGISGNVKGAPKKANVQQMLKFREWDIVTIQQASHESWKAETYKPYADELIAEIRRLAPQAEIVVQQTWAYCNADGRIYNYTNENNAGSWGINREVMYSRLSEAYKALAAEYGFRVIPAGKAVQIWRETLPVTWDGEAWSRKNEFVYPARPSLGGDVVGIINWDIGHKKIGGDTIHLNAKGKYLQACVWLSFLFNLDLTDSAFMPRLEGAAPEQVKLLRECAVRAVREGL